MTANIQYKGTDLDSIYETPRLGAARANVNYQVAGTDISNRFTDLAATTQANGNLATRIPSTGIITSAGTDLSSLFAGNPGQYSTTTLTTQSGSTALSVGTTKTLTHQFTVTFASAAALTNYFTYGGRIMITAANTGGAGTADSTLATMLSSMGTFVILDATNAGSVGHYRTGAGGTVNNPTIGGTNIGTSSTLLYTLTDGSPYTSSNYTITMVADAAAGSARILTITCVLTLVQSGTIADSYSGTRTSQITQRNYSGAVTPTQSAPSYSTVTFNW
jgi:hypothetical protein